MSKDYTFSISKRSFWSAVDAILFGVFTYFQFVGYIIPELYEFFTLGHETAIIYHIGLIWPPIIGYSLLSCEAILIALIFKDLKSPDENGFIKRLVESLAIGLTIGLVWGIFSILNVGLLVGLVLGLCIGLTASLLWGFGFGLHSEFSNTEKKTVPETQTC